MVVAPARAGESADRGGPDRSTSRAGAQALVGEVPSGVAPRGVVGNEKAARWVWDDTGRWYPRLLADGVRVERCLDLRLAHRVLRGAAATAGSRLATAPSGPFDVAGVAEPEPDRVESLFDVAAPQSRPDEDALLAEIGAQDEAVADHPRLRLLLVAESAGALAAAEMRHTGLPWDRRVHDEVLAEQLGPRPSGDARPPRMAELAAQIRAELGAPRLNPDSLPDVLRELRRNGLPVTSTSKWELTGLDHPAVAPLLAYKKLSRLHSANGWAWLDRWVPEDRFRPEYVVGGVVTGRWGSSGGGALQLPKQIRRAVRADEGWCLVVADAAQLEPRVLAGLSHDERMAEAGRGRDLYQGMVDAGVVDSRDHAKVGMLGALYGGTTGQSAAVLPRINRAFPLAMAHVEAAARAGERGEVVSTLLGRSSPLPGAQWNQVQADALDDEAGASAQSRARAQTRAWGRFTRNFVVQGTAAEWALCWIAEVRRRLWALGESTVAGRAPEPFARRPHLVYFLHDELVVHAPQELAEVVATQVRDAATAAGRLLFGEFPIDFPVSLASARSYADAKD
ncbi:bifunctional 3'-5' exonuclease/DNA polymerase [Cellulomonas sp. PhB150]|uniref:bifunctional 3'-5' exonuclease/DNA polymerase n=1 Tax=Cellulomonas sp. PhB150 TaxID=2485188 RepID=UPI000F463D57|nr:bifunctional 3'-5' exonuclease/DNA polymerase [Cellulomonas sp. PhB150]